MNKNNFSTLVATIFASGLVACGGGGGSSAPVTTPAPIVSVSLSQAKTTVGSSVTLTWSSTNATSCVGLDSMTAGAQAKSGSTVITTTVGGQFTYTISCDGAGGTAKNSVLLIVPIPVQKTSYQNAKNLNIPSQRYPTASQFDHTGDHSDYEGAGVAYADFFQEGKLSMVWFSNRTNYDPIKPAPPGIVKFFKFDDNGNPVEYTTTILSNTTGCSAPRKLLVADFNGDGKPDIFASCHGPEFGSPFPGEHPRVLLSQQDGTYKNIETSLNCYCHGAAAADLNGDGFVDILTSDARAGVPNTDVSSDVTKWISLINDGHGNFTINRNYANIVPQQVAKNTGFSVELVDVNGDGQPDLIVGTSDDLHQPSKVLLNNNGKFGEITVIMQTGIPGFWAIDIVVKDSNIYLYGLANYNTTFDYAAVYKFSLNSNTGSIIYSSNGKQWSGANVPNDFVWIMPYNGFLVPFSDAYTGVKIPM